MVRTVSHPNPLEERIIDDFTQAGLSLQFTENFFEKQWTKLTLNIPIFILTIKYDISSKTALSNERYAAELALLRVEIQQVAKAYSIEVDASFISQVDEQLIASVDHTYPSMKVDYDNKNNLELETTILPVIEMAMAKHVEIPCLVSECVTYLDIESYQAFVQCGMGEAGADKD